MLCKPAYPLHSTRTVGNGFPGKCGHQGHRKRPPAAYSFCLWSISPALPCSGLWDWTSISPLFHEMGSLVLLTLWHRTLLLGISDFSWSMVFLSSGYSYCKFDLCVLNPGLYILDLNLSPDTNPILIFTSWFSLLLLFLILCCIYWLTDFYDSPMSAHEGQHNREN